MKNILKYILYGFFVFTGIMILYSAFTSKDIISKEPKTEINTDSINAVSESEKALADSLREIAREKAVKMLSTLKKTSDEFSDNEFYKSKSTGDYVNSNRFYIYLGRKGDQAWLRLAMSYYADDWLFIENTQVKVGDNIYKVVWTGEDRDNEAGKVWEWVDLKWDVGYDIMIQHIIDNKGAKLRHNGRQYYKERSLTGKEIKALKDVYEVYRAFKEIG